MSLPRNAVLFGATGLIGSHLLHGALAGGIDGHVTAATRRPLPVRHPRLSNLITDFTRLERHDWPHDVDVAFCCLGTTIGAAGSRAAFRAVDHDLVLTCARWARRLGARHFLAVSAIGADASSPVFYSRVKGETERDLEALGFAHLSLFQPSLLLGEREGPVRRGEALGGLLMPLFSPLLAGPLDVYRPVQARDVARAMLAEARAPQGGAVTRLRWRAIMAAAARLDLPR